jgi:ferredoxin-nitrite reductase
MEIHWLKEADLSQVKLELAKVGLTSRGACGGAVRGVSCGSQGAQGFPVLESLARRIHLHFTGNLRFEHLPKKFKISVEADIVGGRHLIQDVGLVQSSIEDGNAWYDIWIAGGLGRKPRPGFLLVEHVPEGRIIQIIEAIIKVYATHAPPPKRLKFLVENFGEEKLRQLIEAEAVYGEEIPAASGLPEHFVPKSDGHARMELPVFAGNLAAGQLELIANAADRNAAGVLMVTANQDIALLLVPGADAAAELIRLQQSTLLPEDTSASIFRICPGSHECRMGLAATREVASEIQARICKHGIKLSWALSGCPNSCTQPQLADVGIVASSLVADTDGQKTPRFDVYCRKGIGLGQLDHAGLALEELIAVLQEMAGN